ncbi:MAG: hypothetical protein A2413_02465 [Treponema sp. RIFOXYC1_FULL_61_9]|nr:MAG: hypothetical protein A2413_02465 [Treponema sp. RIFOXYC1_FULL_61_9]
MATKKSGRFFYRLLGAFLAVGVLPVAVASISLSVASRSVLERSLIDRARSSAAIAAGGLGSLLETYAAIAEELAEDSAIIEYLATPVAERNPGRVADANRRLHAPARVERVAVYLIPEKGSALGTAPLPTEYAKPAYRSWGALGAFAREVVKSKESEKTTSVLIFGRPHSENTNPAIFAVGRAVPATPRPEGPAGYVVIDIHRLMLEELFSGAKEAFTGFNLLDSSGCVLFDLNGSYREGSFADNGAAAMSGETTAFIDKDANRIVTGIRTAFGIDLVAYQSMAPIAVQSAGLRSVSIFAGLFSALAAVALALVFSRSISDPINQLVKVMGRVQDGELDARFILSRDDDIGYLVSSFNRMVSRIELLVAERVEQQRRLRISEAQALQARIDPHFLYNTLNSIKSIARLRGVDEIATISTRLGRLLRAGFAPEGEFSTLEESMELVRCYLEIEEIRYPNRFTFSIDIEPALLGVSLPRLVIQPLVENAVGHGLEKKVGVGRLSIAARKFGADVVIRVEDDGTGISAERLKRIRAALELADGEYRTETPSIAEAGEDSTGIALTNIHRRIRLYYGPRYGLEIEGREGGGTRSILRIPIKAKGERPC